LVGEELLRFVSAAEMPLASVSANREVCNCKPLIFLGQDIPIGLTNFVGQRRRGLLSP